jgi:hypothetical protein
VRECRRRQRSGLVLMKIEIDPVAVSELLIDSGFLPAWDAENRAKIEQALEAAIAVWSRP